MIKLEEGKTEVLFISTPYFTDMLKEYNLRVGDATVRAIESARNIGVMFDSNLDMSDNIKSVCRASFSHLRNLRSIKDTLTHDKLENVTHVCIISRPDNCKTVWYGLPQSSILKMQRIQNVTGRWLTSTNTFY